MNDGASLAAMAVLFIPANLLQLNFGEQDHGNCTVGDAVVVDENVVVEQNEFEGEDPCIRRKHHRIWHHEDRNRGLGWKSATRFHKAWEQHITNARRLANHGRVEEAERVAAILLLPKAMLSVFNDESDEDFVNELLEADASQECALLIPLSEDVGYVDCDFEEADETDPYWWGNDVSDEDFYDSYDRYWSYGFLGGEDEELDYLSFCLKRQADRFDLRGVRDAEFVEVVRQPHRFENWDDQEDDWPERSIDELDEWESDRYWEDRMTDDLTNEELDDQNTVEAEWEEFIEDDEETEIRFEWDIPSDPIDDFDDPRDELPRIERIRNRRNLARV